ncbi:hypothetical protein [Pseudoxanthomonas sp. JBR18]|uniref:hypothetical protein n=1 Tax=Pseudoxanthomonas sp. JBR18 TaxID=2969308 RepID=UPI00230655EF|nr:hypothetical protein [Pseudoxanthomonas sp. JBR18]WCE05575.1 hypothetical protein PJ250_06340 [Pseudoxanthomonas sp. JBR18]
MATTTTTTTTADTTIMTEITGLIVRMAIAPRRPWSAAAGRITPSVRGVDRGPRISIVTCRAPWDDEMGRLASPAARPDLQWPSRRVR